MEPLTDWLKRKIEYHQRTLAVIDKCNPDDPMRTYHKDRSDAFAEVLAMVESEPIATAWGNVA